MVAHCGSQPKGRFLSTLTLTDIATGWTECFPLLTKSAEAVVSAFQQARACFPFPILGLDTDNGCLSYINAYLLAYCEQVVPVCAPDPVPSCQPEQDANGTTPSRGRGTCSAQVVPSQQPGEEGVLPSQPIGEEKETICPLPPANSGAAQGG